MVFSGVRAIVPLFLAGLGLVFFGVSVPFFNSSCSWFGVLSDRYSCLTIFILIVVVFTSYCVSDVRDSWRFRLSLLMMTLACVVVFVSDRTFLIYVFFEVSLLPIIFIILKWGSYAARSIRTLMLLLYTAVFRIPFLFVLIRSLRSGSLRLILVGNSVYRGFCVLCVFLMFAVKLPVYGIHFWLPMAHVEAPTFGSILLAGVLLKLGGIGLVRFRRVSEFSSLSDYLIAYLFVGLLLSSLVRCVQSDFKRLIAYSSIVHMLAVPMLILVGSGTSFTSLLLIMVFHGIRSPALFLLVGVVYSIYGSRQFVFIRGLFVCFPWLGVVRVLLFFFTLPAPPFPSFFGEVLFVISLVGSWGGFYVFLGIIVLFIFLGVVFNVAWLTRILFLVPLVDTSYSLSYRFASSFIMFILVGLVGVLIFRCF